MNRPLQMGPCLRVPGGPSFDDADSPLEPMQQRRFLRADRDRDTRVLRGSPGFIDPDGTITKDEAKPYRVFNGRITGSAVEYHDSHRQSLSAGRLTHS